MFQHGFKLDLWQGSEEPKWILKWLKKIDLRLRELSLAAGKGSQDAGSSNL